MKKILIITRKMECGGVEKALISMLNCISPNKYDIKVMTIYEGGELLKDIPKWVKVETIPGITQRINSKVLEQLKKGKMCNALKIIYYTIKCKNAKKVYEGYKYNLKILPVVDDEYDLAISYYNPTSFTIAYVIDKVKAKKKIMWIHADVNRYKDIFDYKEYYEKYDFIYNVSKAGAIEFIKLFPDLKYKTDVFYNIIDEKLIMERSNTKISLYGENFQGVKLVTVARLSVEKGQDMIPIIARKLINDGINIKWYCLGEGDLRKEIEKNIEKFKVKDNVILLGNIKNPFPYIKQCDVYVQTSRSECYCTTVMEAKSLKKPIVVTEVNGTREQIINRHNGVIVSQDVDSIYKGINLLINDQDLRDDIITNLKSECIDTKNEVKKIFNDI